MTEQQIQEQIRVIKKVADELKGSPERIAAFFREAGIPSTPLLKKSATKQRRNKY